MNWRVSRLTYDILIPKLEKSIFELNENETLEYFEWFTEQIPSRINYVSYVCANELRIPMDKMDLSPESLLILWKWFRKRAKIETVQLSNAKNRNAASTNGLLKNARQLTLETEYIIRDIGMYLGETFRNNYPQIYWTYYTKPKRGFFVNHPLLKGFVDMTTGVPYEAVFEPIHMVGVQASKLLSNKSRENDLLDIYRVWSEKIHNK